MAKKDKKNCCPECNEEHEKCADGRTCKKWRISYEVCVAFGTRPYETGRSSTPHMQGF